MHDITQHRITDFNGRVGRGEQNAVRVASDERGQHLNPVGNHHEISKHDVEVATRGLLNRLRCIRACFGLMAEVRNDPRDHHSNISIVIDN